MQVLNIKQMYKKLTIRQLNDKSNIYDKSSHITNCSAMKLYPRTQKLSKLKTEHLDIMKLDRDVMPNIKT